MTFCGIWLVLQPCVDIGIERKNKPRLWHFPLFYGYIEYRLIIKYRTIFKIEGIRNWRDLTDELFIPFNNFNKVSLYYSENTF